MICIVWYMKVYLCVKCVSHYKTSKYFHMLFSYSSSADEDATMEEEDGQHSSDEMQHDKQSDELDNVQDSDNDWFNCII